MNHCTFRAEWSPEEGQYVGRCLELPYVKERAPTAPEAVACASAAVDEHLDGLRAGGGDPPVPLTERHYSGTFVVRTSPMLHARLAIDAEEQRVSMNQWVIQQLSGRPARGSIDSLFFD